VLSNFFGGNVKFHVFANRSLKPTQLVFGHAEYDAVIFIKFAPLKEGVYPVFLKNSNFINIVAFYEGF
jgi:hypothetical protein